MTPRQTEAGGSCETKGYEMPRENETTHISQTFPEVIQELAKRHEITEREVIERLRGKVVMPDDK